EEPVTHEDIVLEGRHIEISGVYEMVEASDDGKPRVREETVEEWVEIDDLDDGQDDDDDLNDDRREAPDDDRAQFDRVHDDTYRDAAQDTEALSEIDLLPYPRRSRAAWAWKVLAAPLALLLVAQLVHHHRATLARHPRVGPPLMKLY